MMTSKEQMALAVELFQGISKNRIRTVKKLMAREDIDFGRFVTSDKKNVYHYAARRNVSDRIFNILEGKCSHSLLNDADDTGRTPLATACCNNRISLAVRMAELGADPYIPDSMGLKPTQYLVDKEAAAKILSASPIKRKRPTKNSLLLDALNDRDPDAVTDALLLGADVGYVEDSSWNNPVLRGMTLMIVMSFVRKYSSFSGYSELWDFQPLRDKDKEQFAEAVKKGQMKTAVDFIVKKRADPRQFSPELWRSVDFPAMSKYLTKAARKLRREAKEEEAALSLER